MNSLRNDHKDTVIKLWSTCRYPYGMCMCKVYTANVMMRVFQYRFWNRICTNIYIYTIIFNYIYLYLYIFTYIYIHTHTYIYIYIVYTYLCVFGLTGILYSWCLVHVKNIEILGKWFNNVYINNYIYIWYINIWYIYIYDIYIYVYIYIWYTYLYMININDIYICDIYICDIYIYIYTVKMKVRMPPRIPNIPPPQLECGPRTAKNPSVRMPPHPGFIFFCFWRTLCTNPSLRMPPHYEYHQMLECS